MKSLRELREELTGIRLAAANQSLWSIVATVDQRAHIAINDALRVYEFRMPAVYTSGQYGAKAFALPGNAHNVVTVTAVSQDTGRRIPMYEYRHRPTPQTNILEVFSTPLMSNGYVEVEYEVRAEEMPEDTFVWDPVRTGPNLSILTALNVTGTNPAAYWKAPGWIELTNDNTLGREVMYYTQVTTNQFTGLTRAIEGPELPSNAWGRGARISAVMPLESECIAVVQAAAEASMYNYWISHRALYDQYVAIAGIAQVDMSDAVGLVQAAQARAEAFYRRVRKPPSPGRARR